MRKEQTYYEHLTYGAIRWSDMKSEYSGLTPGALLPTYVNLGGAILEVHSTKLTDPLVCGTIIQMRNVKVGAQSAKVLYQLFGESRVCDGL